MLESFFIVLGEYTVEGESGDGWKSEECGNRWKKTHNIWLSEWR